MKTKTSLRHYDKTKKAIKIINKIKQKEVPSWSTADTLDYAINMLLEKLYTLPKVLKLDKEN